MVSVSDIIIVGTVVEVGAAHFDGVPASAANVVVRVDEVLDQPGVLSIMSGDQLTLNALDPASLVAGTVATFYTQGWIFGEGVAVREVGHEIGAGGAVNVGALEVQAVDEVRQQIADRQLVARLTAAELVVVGTVVSVGPETRAAFGPLAQLLITEHDPQWQEAVIQIESTLKGPDDVGDRVVVRFPASMDVVWFEVPKLSESQEGTFILQSDQVSGVQLAMLGATEVPAYTALDGMDVRPRGEADRIRSLLPQ